MKITNNSYKLWMILLAMGSFVTFFTSCDDDTSIPTVENCSNGLDDDGDGDVDCQDGDCATSADCSNVVELGGSIGTFTTDPDKVYVIDRFAYVDDGDVLTVMPGTIFKANTGDGADASALIVARGGRIEANGTAANPIIFTSIDDEIKPGETESTLSFENDAGKWGGLIILGKAPISASLEDGDFETSVEGVPDAFSFSFYGGSSIGDNSGTLNYVSIRFTGTKLATNDEIQGLTLGGVGSGTTLQNIEIISSDDDGVELFGGTVDLNNLLIVAQTDDGIDIDQSYSGTIDNALVLQYNPSAGNDANEIDGPEGPNNATGKFTISNTTYINKSGDSRMARLKSGAQGLMDNCSFRGFSDGILVDGGSANTNFDNGDLEITNCEFVGWAGTLADVLTTDDDANNDVVFAAAGNTLAAAPTKGSTANFDWTFSETIGLID